MMPYPVEQSFQKDFRFFSTSLYVAVCNLKLVGTFQRIYLWIYGVIVGWIVFKNPKLFTTFYLFAYFIYLFIFNLQFTSIHINI